MDTYISVKIIEWSVNMYFSKFKLKKAISVLTAIASVSLCSTSISAANTKIESIYRINQIKSDIIENTKAFIVDEKGNKIDVSVTDVEITEVNVPFVYKSTNSVTRAYTAKVKTSTNNENSNGINAASSLSMTWIDGPGANNSITNLTGYWVVISGTFQHGKIFWGSDDVSDNVYRDVGISFDEDINYTSTNTISGRLTARSNAYIKNSSGMTLQFYTWVTPTIFD